MTKWLIIIVVLISGAILSYIYVALGISSTSAGSSNTMVRQPVGVKIYHAEKDGVQRYSGEIKLPHSCFALKAEAKTHPEDPTTLIIELKAVDNILNEAICAQFSTGYPFEVMIETPTPQHVVLRYNGKDRKMRLIERAWVNAGQMINGD